MVRISKYLIDGDVVPQAIFWRPLKYFSVTLNEGEDGLDVFEVASFIIGNDLQFDLRTYRQHHKFTATLYLPDSIEDEAEVARVIERVIGELVIPKQAVAWRRGESFEFGSLRRPKGDRLQESEARILALKIASLRPNKTASIEDIKTAVPDYTEFSTLDLAQSKTRPREQMWQQVVRNVISHKGSPSGLFMNGHARRTVDGLSVTDTGMTYLNSMGFVRSLALAE